MKAECVAARFWLTLVLIVSVIVACESKPLRKLGSNEPSAGAGGGCEPTTCEALGVACGEVDDGCGVVLRCEHACAEGGAGGGGSCAPVKATATPPRTARRARSTGYSGTPEAYASLFQLPCKDAGECVSACDEAGGEQAMCVASECLASPQGGQDCLPAPVWANLDNIQFEDEPAEQMTQLILVPGDYHDVLLIDHFQLEVPAAATILGITVEIRRAGDDGVADQSVRIVKAGQVGESARALPEVWSRDLTWIGYGGPDDLWGEEWTSENLNAADFGLAFSTAYTRAAGNTRAYVDTARVTVHYEVACN